MNFRTDASDEYIDIQSRIASKRAYLKRYRELLSKAATIKNILEIEEIIRTLQEELESQEQRLANLNNATVLDFYLHWYGSRCGKICIFHFN